MSKSSQQIGQHRFDTTMKFWSMLCISRQIDEHHDDASKNYLDELSQNGVLDSICGRWIVGKNNKCCHYYFAMYGPYIFLQVHCSALLLDYGPGFIDIE